MSGTLSRNSLFFRLLRLATVGLLIAIAFVAFASAQYCTCDECDECNLNACNGSCCHEKPELWVINTRCAPKCCNLDRGFNCIKIQRWDAGCCRFVNESMDSFIAQEASMPTMFYIHGNTLKHKPAMKQCWSIYRKLRCCPGPKRLVFWSWPAQIAVKRPKLRPLKLIMKNLRTKYVYAEYQGYYVAKLVNRMSLSQRVMVSGHSYGGIASATAMHWLGGGCLRGLVLDGGAPVERPNLRAGIIAGAFDSDMLYPGHRFGQAFVAAEKIFVTRNIKDSTLKKWNKVSLRGCPAIGSIGVNARKLGQYRYKLCQKTMTADVHRSHYLKPLLKSTRFVRALCCLSFPSCQDCQVAESDEPSESSLALRKSMEQAMKPELLKLSTAG